MKAISDINDPRLVKGLAHPLRVSILGILEDREASPSELAEELRAPLGNVSYHVRILDNLGLIKLTRKKPRRGAIEHYYKADGRARVTDGAWGEVPGIVKEALVASGLRQAGEYVSQAAAIGGFNRADSNFTRQPLTLDEQGFGELSQALHRLHEEVQQIQARAGERLATANHGGEMTAGLITMLFEAPAQPAFGTDGNDWSISRPVKSARSRAHARRSS